MKIIIGEKEFRIKLKEKLKGINARSVTGPGRSGSIASVYASYFLNIPYIPYKQKCPEKLMPILIIDTARNTGRTLRKAKNVYGENSIKLYIFEEPPRIYFWYENIGDKK